LLQEKTIKTLKRFDSSNFADDALEISKFYNNLDAVITLSSRDNTSKSGAFVDYAINIFIHDNPDSSKMAYVITLSNNTTTNRFKERKNDILPSLEDALKNQTISNEDKELIQDVINILNG